MGFSNCLSVCCWCLAVMVQNSSCYPAFTNVTNGNVQELNAENNDNVLRVKKANGLYVNGVEPSNDLYRGTGSHYASHVVQPHMATEGRGRTEKDHGKFIPENGDHGMTDEKKQRKLDLDFGTGDETYTDFGGGLNEPFDTGILKDVGYKDFLCGPNNTCSCYNRKDWFYVRCSGLALEEFPTSWWLEAANIIDLSDNSISILYLAHISAYPKLSRVSLADNNITDIIGLNNNKKVLQMEYLDLSNNLLERIPDLSSLSRLQNLSLSNNRILNIDRTSFLGMEKLTFLDMSYNDLQRIDEKAFDSLVNLKYFYLNSNVHLGYSDRILSARLFERLNRLEILWIQNNTNSTENQTYPNKALGKLRSLQELAIDGLGKGVPLGPELINLSYLNRLMIGYRGNCYIETIQTDFFAHVKNLKSLIFSSCNFTSNISPDAFRNLSKLEEYAISFPGGGYKLPKAFQDLEGLIYTNVTSLSLEGFVKPFAVCRFLTVNDTKYIKNLKLKTLNLNYNYYSGIEYESLFQIPKMVESILFRCNQFETIDMRWSSLQNLTALYEVDLRDQNVNCSTIVDSQQRYKIIAPLIPPAARKILPLVDSKLSFGYEPVCAKFEVRCKKEDNWEPIYNSTCNPYDLSMMCIPPNVTVVKSSGYIEFAQALFTRKLSPNKICYLDFSRGLFTSWGKGTIPEAVRVADLGDNFCSTLSETAFPINNSLEYLCIENNYLGPVFARDEVGAIFSRLKHLKYLNASGNHIFYLKPSFFKGLRNLTELHLMDNRIENVHLNFSVMPKLRFIDLSKNAIKWISRQSRRQLDALAEDHTVFLDLSYNPLPCSCEGIEILQWLEYTNVRINGLFLTCKDENQNTVPIGDINARLRALQRRCKPNAVLIIASSFCCAIFTIVIVSGLLYKHRWKLIYAKNIWLVNLYGFRPGGNVASQHRYDAYVVYCEDDRDFALYDIIEELEEKRGHKLCVEDRDFIPGSFNFNNVTCAILNSTVTILLLSPEFVRNKELEYATQMALMEQYNNQTNRDLILLLCYREVPEQEMTKDLLMLMKKGRFLDFPESGDDSTKQGFWDRVSDEIGHTRRISDGHMLDSN